MADRANEPVHPAQTVTLDHTGLTIREHFAGLAMQGLLAGRHFSVTSGPECAAFARFAAQQADALIAALNQGERK